MNKTLKIKPIIIIGLIAIMSVILVTEFFLQEKLPLYTIGNPKFSNENEVNHFQGKVISYTFPLRFSLDCCQAETLVLGTVSVVDNSRENLLAIEQIIRTHQLSCMSFKDTSTVAPKPLIHTVWCYTEDNILLSQILFERGLVVENCWFSSNQFGSCLGVINKPLRL